MLLAAVLLALTDTQALASSRPSSLVFGTTEASFGEVFQGNRVRHAFTFTNEGSGPVTIVRAEAASPAGSAEAEPRVVPPGGQGMLYVEQAVGERLGESAFRFVVETDDSPVPRKLMLQGFVQSAYEPENLDLDFGVQRPGASATLTLGSREVDRLTADVVGALPPFLKLDASERTGLAGEGVLLRLTIAPNAPLAFHVGEVKLRTNVPQQPEVTLHYRGAVYDDVVPKESPIDLGVVREGQPFEKIVELRSRSGEPFLISGLRADRPDLQATLVPCSEATGSPCQGVRLAGALGGGLKTFAGDVTVLLDGRQPLTLRYGGVLVGADVRVKSLGELLGPAPVPEPSRKAEPDAPTPPVLGRPGVREARLAWEAKSEDGTYGYLVYRSEKREGPFRRASPTVIPVVRDQAGRHGYSFVDRDVVPGRTYYYYVESVSRGGEKKRLSGVLAKTIAAEPTP